MLEQVKTLKQAGAKEALDAKAKANKIIDSLHEKLEQKDKLLLRQSESASSSAKRAATGNQV